MALPFGRATFFGSGGVAWRRTSQRCWNRKIFPEVRGTRCVFGVQDHRECFRSSGVSGRKMCCGAPETLRSEEGFEAGGTREEKYAVVPRKLRRAGHQQENYMQIPQKAVKWV